MSDHYQQLEGILRSHRLSVTQSRTKVFRALYGQPPLTVAQLAIACQSSVDRASVYRITALYEKLGIVQRLPYGWKYKLELSDQFENHHHHATCSQCHQTIHLPEDDRLETYLSHLADQLGFKITAHQVELTGTCMNC